MSRAEVNCRPVLIVDGNAYALEGDVLFSGPVYADGRPCEVGDMGEVDFQCIGEEEFALCDGIRSALMKVSP